MTPTARTLQQLRAGGWIAVVVEHWNPHARITQDLLGFIDVLAFHPELGTLAVQATTGANAAARISKIVDDNTLRERARTYLLSGRGHHALEVWSWRRLKVRRGGTAIRWELARRPISLEDLNGTTTDLDALENVTCDSPERTTTSC